MAGFSVNRMLGTLKKRPTFGSTRGAEDAPADPANESPQDTAYRCVKQFCQSAGSSTGDDVVYLPSIVEAAVASPAAAEESARLIRKYMNVDYWSKPSCQYNAVMLLRILADNPGPGFTRFLDKKFVDVAKELLRHGRDASVRQLLMETLDAFDTTKADDSGLELLIAMWRKEKAKAFQAYGGAVPVVPVPPVNPYNVPPPPAGPPPPNGYYPHHAPQPHHHHSRHHRPRRLPDPVELANRLEEARSSAKLLEQLIACTPPSEVLTNDLVREFADRCHAASRSIQGYINATNPAPDTDTMESMIDANEQLQHSLNLHQRAVLQARKLLDQSGPQSQQQQQQQQRFSRSSTSPDLSRPLPSLPSRKPVGSGFGHGTTTTTAGSSRASPSNGNDADGKNKQPYRPAADEEDDDGLDPFRDPPNLSDSNAPRLSFEPFHPGFTSASGSGSGSGAASGTVKGTERGAGPTTATAAAPQRPYTPPSVSDSSLDDVYGATPKRETVTPKAAR
ncbi:hypothetical protein VTJ83DRAFT_1575 [Remersonia thermophila]|uniref:GAT domain-containing protein n=1 Tax=Remersonia thermophila TaxID=72144 RepID=A0ABR4DHS8_9PEZI